MADEIREKEVTLFAQNMILLGIQLTHRLPEYGEEGEEEMREAVRLSRALYSEVDRATGRPQRKVNPEPEESDGL